MLNGDFICMDCLNLLAVSVAVSHPIVCVSACATESVCLLLAGSHHTSIVLYIDVLVHVSAVRLATYCIHNNV